MFRDPSRKECSIGSDQGPINPEAQGKEPAGTGQVGANLPEITLASDTWEESYKRELSIKWKLCQAVTFIPTILQKILFMKLRQDPSIYWAQHIPQSLPALWEEGASFSRKKGARKKISKGLKNSN